MKKQLSAVLSLLLMLCLLLAACGGSSRSVADAEYGGSADYAPQVTGKTAQAESSKSTASPSADGGSAAANQKLINPAVWDEWLSFFDTVLISSDRFRNTFLNCPELFLIIVMTHQHGIRFGNIPMYMPYPYYPYPYYYRPY